MNLKYQYQAQAGLQHVVSPQNSPLQYVSLHVPWALLSGGVSFEIFLHQVRLAREEAAALKGEARKEFLQQTDQPRIEVFQTCTAQSGMDKYSVQEIGAGWYGR